MADRHLEAAAEELMAAADAPGGGDYWEALADRTVAAYLDSLLGELPEEAVTAACEASGHDPQWRVYRKVNAAIAKRVLRSLRDSLAPGPDGGEHG